MGKRPPTLSVMQPRSAARHWQLHSASAVCTAVKQASSSQVSRTPRLPACFARDSDMLDFMENVQNAFYEASHWNLDNSYGALNNTARGKCL
jgi:hypothetical protein